MSDYDFDSPSCWFSQLPDAGPCDGRLVKCHLITRQQLRRAWSSWHASWLLHPLAEGEPRFPSSVRDLLADPRCWVYGCGGAMGPGGHHGQWQPDGPRKIPRHLLPPGLEEFAAEIGLSWWLDRTYGPVAGQVAA